MTGPVATLDELLAALPPPTAETIRDRALALGDTARTDGSSHAAALLAVGAATAWALYAEAERGRAQATAVHLEQQLAAVAAFHTCGHCGFDMPCPTARAIGADL